MRKPRVYIDQALATGDVITLSEDKRHYLNNVLRIRKHAGLILFNNTNFEFDAEIIKLDKKTLCLEILECIEKNHESPLQITLILSLSQSQKMDFSLQKAVELGVHRIVPIFTEFSKVKLQESKLDNKLTHWNNIIISAAEQCGRNRLPELCAPISFAEGLQEYEQSTKLILHPGAEQAMSALTLADNKLLLILGPEGGFSDEEINMARQYHCIPVHLGPRILRAETAVVAGLAVAQQCWGDLN